MHTFLYYDNLQLDFMNVTDEQRGKYKDFFNEKDLVNILLRNYNVDYNTATKDVKKTGRNMETGGHHEMTNQQGHSNLY